MEQTELLVIGAGPYGYAAAAHAQSRGIATRVIGRPMESWRDHMPSEMFLRSSRDWSLDVENEHSFMAFAEVSGVDPGSGPIPIAEFLAYCEWFRVGKGLSVTDTLVTELSHDGHEFTARTATGELITARKVLSTPGLGYFAHSPSWCERISSDRWSHTAEAIQLEELAGSRVAIIGGRQSAYEWAAILADHHAERVDVIHRHETPTFAEVSWKFVDEYLEQTRRVSGWWQTLPLDRRAAIQEEFWRVGRLTLEPWLAARLDPAIVNVHQQESVVDVSQSASGTITLTLGDASELEVDYLIAATGFRAEMSAVPYLSGLSDRLAVAAGFPVLTEGSETTVPGLYMSGFCATAAFGPFFGFTAGCATAAQIVVNDLLATRSTLMRARERLQ